ncbi:hypothetical protein BC828DRAFT_91712 [Blastocladiella britannica]|nr:hypothetical protein BC828DRAFT_91712 [Blastocladiella britannica]
MQELGISRHRGAYQQIFWIPNAPTPAEWTAASSDFSTRAMGDPIAALGAERVAEMADKQQIDPTNPSLTRNGHPALHRIHWRRIIVHKVPWMVDHPCSGKESMLPLLSAFQADSWVSIVPPASIPTEDGCDDRISVVHIHEAIVGSVLTDHWNRDLPMDTVKKLAPSLAYCCLGLLARTAAPDVPPIDYVEVPVYLSQTETVLGGLGALLDPSDNGLAVRAAQHHRMVSFGLQPLKKPIYVKYPEELSSMCQCWTALTASRSQQFLGLGSLGVYDNRQRDPFVVSALQWSLAREPTPTAATGLQHDAGATAVDILEWLASSLLASITKSLENNALDSRAATAIGDCRSRCKSFRHLLSALWTLQQYGFGGTNSTASALDGLSQHLFLSFTNNVTSNLRGRNPDPRPAIAYRHSIATWTTLPRPGLFVCPAGLRRFARPLCSSLGATGTLAGSIPTGG